MNHLAPAPTRLLKITAAVARWLLFLLLSAWLLFGLALGLLHGWIVPRIDEYRPTLEKQASRVLGVPVRIGAIEARSSSLFPMVELHDVVLLDPEGREALRLPRVLASVSPRSALHLGFEQLYIDKPELDIRRTAAGRLTIAGLDFSRSDGDNTEAQDWFFSQSEFVIRGGTVRWTDEQRAAGTLSLADVDFVARNSARRHSLRLDATPPVEWGDRFTLMGQFRQPLLVRRAGQWQEWDGQLHADFARVDVSQLRRHADIGADLREGLGALRVWVDVARGELLGATADAALAQVNVQLGKELQPLMLRSVSGRVGGRRLPGGFEFSTTGLQFDADDGLHWPGGNVFMRYTEPAAGTPSGEFRADRLDLAALAQIAHRLPLGDAAHDVLDRHAPRGLVETVQSTWTGPIGSPTRYEAKGRVAGLEIAASSSRTGSGTPGIRGATIDFEFTQAGGKAGLSITRGALDLPGVFEDPLVPVDQLSGNATWKLDGPKIDVQVGNLVFANADAQGEARASWHTSDAATSSSRSRFPGVLDLSGTLSRADGTRVYRYLPAHIPKDVRSYVQEAVTTGTASDVKFRVKGDLHDMPFADPKKGDFHISAQVRNVNFAYVPRSSLPKDSLQWPALNQLSGELVFDRLSMRVKGATARLQGAPALQVTQADATIPDLSHNTTVQVDGTIKGPLGDALKVVGNSPLGALTGGVLSKSTGTGNADVQLGLILPVHTIDKSKVSGSVTLQGNDIQFTPDTPQLARARGVVSFNEGGFTVSNGQARMLGGDLRIEGGSRMVAGESVVQLRAQGTATADGLRQARELGFLSRLAQNASGGASYNAVLGFRRGMPELQVSSNLQGLGLSLPAPLNKTAESALPLRFENTLVRESLTSGPLLDQLVLDLGRVANVTYVRDVSGAQTRVLRGGIGIGLAPNEFAPMPDDGVLANINLTSVDIDAWEDALSKAAGASINTASAPAATAESQAAQGYLPTQVAVRARELVLEGRKLNNVVVGGSREGTTWRANLDANELNGYVEYRQGSGATPGRLYARLARMNIAQGATSDVEALLNEQPANIPALDIVVDDFELRGKKLGRVEVEAVNRVGGPRDGTVREWRLSKLNLTTPDAIFSATGNWTAINAQGVQPSSVRTGRPAAERRRTVMNFRLDIANAGDLLGRFGMKDVVRRGKGRMEGQVAWLGSPLTPDYPSMSGQFNVNVEEGQFLKADPGLAKLLGVLSLQSLPRRLTLDFRDVFSEGFGFDFVRGDVKIDQGIASTNNLQMKGVNAAVLMEGRASLAAETQDIRVVVVPEINAGTASLVATAINPAIGLGTFLAQWVLRRPLIQATTQEFHIDGTWTDPRITRIEKKGLPATTEPRQTGKPADSPATAAEETKPGVLQ
ncbi:YhdP family protein [Variovorax sp. VNK109]|uniref:YhdP family protein n=1 Tax=Variovorax sp. VNK109 TaxID=3400919 RepID=UPI003C12402B